MIGVGDTVIEYDAATNSPKIGSSLQSSNTTRVGAIRTDGILASGIGLSGSIGGSGGNVPIGNGGNGMIEVDRLVGQKTNNPNNVGANKEATNQGYSLVTRNNLVELRISAERNTRLTLLLKEGKDSTGNL